MDNNTKKEGERERKARTNKAETESRRNIIGNNSKMYKEM